MSPHEQFAEDLALYSLGALEGTERQALEKHLETCAGCRRELELLRGDGSLLALTTAGPKPPARARQRLLSAIANEPRLSGTAPVPEHRQGSIVSPIEVSPTEVSPTEASPTEASPTEASPTEVTPPWWSNFAWPALGWFAAAALALVCIGLMRQKSTLQQDIVSQRAQFRAEINDQGNKLQQANEVVATLLDPEATKIELVAVGAKPQPRGKAIYQRRNRNLIFIASNLPPLPAHTIYELWLFPAGGGAPIAAGLFKPDARGSATVVNPPLPEGIEAKNFVVTLEPESGSHAAPRGTPVIVGVG